MPLSRFGHHTHRVHPYSPVIAIVLLSLLALGALCYGLLLRTDSDGFRTRRADLAAAEIARDTLHGTRTSVPTRLFAHHGRGFGTALIAAGLALAALATYTGLTA
ncbi:hypothetical protein CFP65_5506 [Kitasatospora sp. MMS16-BH015]|uniref:hypothetical protein n=1 Tax=Kitasatospora sp. MMS16-BH015 TaxID=2018025 RepID=UPI000CA3C49F|nr:hypothetical protein [Kitasatospora sp. MMS16-BH015]AUG80204.1 hypothetical protein CFP65_5506 [Kitasatospora sp. MMS16-BH015]